MADGRSVRQNGSDIYRLGDAQNIFQFDAKVTNSSVNLSMAEQQLDRA